MAFSIQLPRQPTEGDEIEICGVVHEPLQVFSLNLTQSPRHKAIAYHLKVDYENRQIIQDWRDSHGWQNSISTELSSTNMGQHDQQLGFRFRFKFRRNSVDVFEEGDNYLASHEIKMGLKNINYLEVWEDTRQSNNHMVNIVKLNFTFANNGT
uniref:Galectin n=1 Tax=Culicoides sonorensis TaxID=179676 RepID=A0A336MZ45_CULSO